MSALFVGSVCRIKTMDQLLCFKSKFPNHFMFTLGCYLFLLFLGLVYLMWMLTIVIYINIVNYIHFGSY